MSPPTCMYALTVILDERVQYFMHPLNTDKIPTIDPPTHLHCLHGLVAVYWFFFYFLSFYFLTWGKPSWVN